MLKPSGFTFIQALWGEFTNCWPSLHAKELAIVIHPVVELFDHFSYEITKLKASGADTEVWTQLIKRNCFVLLRMYAKNGRTKVNLKERPIESRQKETEPRKNYSAAPVALSGNWSRDEFKSKDRNLPYQKWTEWGSWGYTKSCSQQFTTLIDHSTIIYKNAQWHAQFWLLLFMRDAWLENCCMHTWNKTIRRLIFSKISEKNMQHHSRNGLLGERSYKGPIHILQACT